MAVINELAGEKIDVISWEEKPEKFIANSLSPAKIVGVKVEDKNTAIVFVPEDQLSLAIGKDGRNVRLAAQLTGWKIDIKPTDVPAESEADGEEISSEENDTASAPKEATAVKAKKSKEPVVEIIVKEKEEKSEPEEAPKKKIKKAKKVRIIEDDDVTDDEPLEEIAVEGDDPKEDPTKVDAETEELPIDNPTEEESK